VPSFTASTLLLAIGIIQILLGTAVLTSPLPPVWRPGVEPAALAAYGTSFVFFGVVAFIVHVTQATFSRLWRVAGNVICVLPLLAASGTAFTLGATIAATTYAALGLVSIAFATLARPAGGADRLSTDALVVTVFVIETALGVLLLAAPSAFGVPIYRELLTSRIPLAALLLLGAAAVFAASWTRRLLWRVGAAVVASVPLLLIAGAVIRAQGQWPGVFVYPILAGFLVAHPWLERSLVAQRQAVAERPSVAAFQRAAEGVVWAVILLMAIAANIQPPGVNRAALHVLVLGTSVFTLIWFRLPPAARPLQRTLWGIVIYALLAGAVTHVTGGVRTPVIFLLILPILAAAWALPPRYITLPAGIALLVIAVEIAWQVLQGEAFREVISTALFRASGLGFVAAFAYLLARRAVEQRALLRQEKEKLETVVASMGDGLIALDAAGRIQFCNRAAESLLQRAHPEVVGRPLLQELTIRREDGLNWPDAEHPVAVAVARGESTRQRVLVSRPGEATPYPFALTVTPLHDPQGRPSGAICSLQDVAPELEMERMRDDFFNIASHEIRTPLTVIKGHVELALDGSLGELGETARHVLMEIHTATARLIRMVNDFLDAARVEQGRLAVQIDRGTLPGLVQQAIDTLAGDARRKGLTLTYRLPDPAAVPAVLMDAGKALQVLINLIDNGIKFTTRGGVEIWHEVENGMVATYVADTGVGIRADQRHRLFERFSQLERGLRRETGGSGLGLYISRKLAEHMHGTVNLKDSVPDGGSTFVFALPRAPERGTVDGARDVTRERTGTR